VPLIAENRSNLIVLTATGVLPCRNYIAQLEQRPERIFPPEWSMVFFAQDYCERAILEFVETVRFVGDPGTTSEVFVHDALGRHPVTVQTLERSDITASNEGVLRGGEIPWPLLPRDPGSQQ